MTQSIDILYTPVGAHRQTYPIKCRALYFYNRKVELKVTNY
jgi:hypothetical protein